MADTVAQASLMPLSGEVGLAQYISNLFGGGAKLNASSLAQAPATLQATQLDEYTPEQLNQLITEYLRGSGNFLGASREQNLSGLYNTATRNLVSNDILAQAALKATQANTAVKTANAQLQQSNQQANANLATQVALQNAKTQNEFALRKATQPSSAVLGGALGIAALNAILNKTGAGEKVGAATSGILESIFGKKTDTTKKKTDVLATQDFATTDRDTRIADYMQQASDELASIQSAIPASTGYQDISYDPTGITTFTPTQASSDFAISEFSNYDMADAADTISQWANWAPSYTGWDQGSGVGTSIANYDLGTGGGYDFGWDTTPTYDLADASDWLDDFMYNPGSDFGFSWG